MSARHRHRWQRLSDNALFCECGETKVIALAPATFVPYVPLPCTLPHYPSYPTWIQPRTPMPWESPWIVGTTTTTAPALGDVTVWNG